MNLSIFAELELNFMHKARTSRGKAYEKVELSRRVSKIEKFISDLSKNMIRQHLLVSVLKVFVKVWGG
jgi:hypothetical protein